MKDIMDENIKYYLEWLKAILANSGIDKMTPMQVYEVLDQFGLTVYDYALSRGNLKLCEVIKLFRDKQLELLKKSYENEIEMNKNNQGFIDTFMKL